MSSVALFPGVDDDSTRRLWASAAIAAIALPSLVAFNVAPSATLFNQAAALIGWAIFALLLATLQRSAWIQAPAAGANALAAMWLLALILAAAPVAAGLPWSFAWSNVGMILA